MSAKSYQYSYPRPALTTDCVLFGWDNANLNVLLIERKHDPFKGCWALPGGFVEENETVEECVHRELCEETGIEVTSLVQLKTFSQPGRDPRGWTISVAFIGLIPCTGYLLQAGDDAEKVRWFSLRELPALAFDHEEIIGFAFEKLQEIISGCSPNAASFGIEKNIDLQKIIAKYQKRNSVDQKI